MEAFILDRTLEPALATLGLAETTIIDPTCGSGHFLLGAFERGDAWVRLVTIDGSAELCRYGDDLVGLLVNHASGGEVWNVLHRVAEDGGFAVMPVGCGTFVTGDGALVDLPDESPSRSWW